MACYRTVGGKVRAFRKSVKPHLSQGELAKRLRDAGLDVGLSGVEQIESGEFTLNYYQLSILAAALNTTNNQLLS